MITLYVQNKTKDFILDIVAARAGMRISKVNSDCIIIQPTYIIIYTYYTREKIHNLNEE